MKSLQYFDFLIFVNDIFGYKKLKLVYTALNFYFSFMFSAELSDIREEMMLAVTLPEKG